MWFRLMIQLATNHCALSARFGGLRATRSGGALDDLCKCGNELYLSPLGPNRSCAPV